jgi:hypothetical protein
MKAIRLCSWFVAALWLCVTTATAADPYHEGFSKVPTTRSTRNFSLQPGADSVTFQTPANRGQRVMMWQSRGFRTDHKIPGFYWR